MKGIKLSRLDNAEFRKLNKEYIESSKVLSYFYINKLKEPLPAVTRYKMALNAVRDYLNMIQCPMPVKLYPYDIEDLATHKYIETKQVRVANYSTTATNPNFKYDRAIYGKKIY
jgi:hypothetical protein